MDELEKDTVTKAIGKAAAAICVQSAVMGMLAARDVFEDVATLIAITGDGLNALQKLSTESREVAQSVLGAFALTRTPHRTPN